jgi:hypothetical protein
MTLLCFAPASALNNPESLLAPRAWPAALVHLPHAPHQQPTQSHFQAKPVILSCESLLGRDAIPIPPTAVQLPMMRRE